MKLVRWDPGFASLERRLENLFDGFFPRELLATGNGRWDPALDVHETADQLIVKAELPGMDEKDLSVTVSGNHLVLRGEKKRDEEQKGLRFHTVERSYGVFERAIRIPASADAEKVTAQFEKGVLEVHIPKKAEAVPKKIAVKAR